MGELTRILVIETQPLVRASLVEEVGEDVILVPTSTADAALRLVRDNEFSAAIVGGRLPDRDSAEVIGDIRHLRPDLPILVVAEQAGVDLAVRSMQAGATDFLTAPLDPVQLTSALERALARREYAGGVRPPPSEARLSEDLLEVAAHCRMSLRELGDRYIDRVLKLTGGNKVAAARILGVNRRTLYRRGVARARRMDSAGTPGAA